MASCALNKLIVMAIIFILFLLPNVLAAGSGSGGASIALGFTNSRDSILLLINSEFSQMFSLRNGTKYSLEIKVDNNKAIVNFDDIIIELKNNDNFIDLNSNNLADINFNLASLEGKKATIRVIDAHDSIAIEKEKPKILDEELKEAKQIDAKPEKAKCNELPTMKERVSCRLSLEEDEQQSEISLNYLPEECSSLSGSARGICIARYKSVQTCWKFSGEERISCVKKTIKLGNLQEEKERCGILAGNEKSSCLNELKNKVYNLIKWRFYDLEEKAEDFMKRGFVGKEIATDFIVNTEQNKMKFNDVEAIGQKKDVILEVRNDWKQFISKIKESEVK
ncbi:hypothetical protein HYX01_00695 [Candidatus Woesearchaeota archaeon]|nr:hypothetical protein [Candidatus Woesearchaeota archaeon]